MWAIFLNITITPMIAGLVIKLNQRRNWIDVKTHYFGTKVSNCDHIRHLEIREK